MRMSCGFGGVGGLGDRKGGEAEVGVNRVGGEMGCWSTGGGGEVD